jgi:hypothetical protein
MRLGGATLVVLAVLSASCLESPGIAPGQGADGAAGAYDGSPCGLVLEDDFPGTTINPEHWDPFEAGGTAQVSGGDLVIDADSTGAWSYAHVLSTKALPLAGSVISAKATFELVAGNGDAILGWTGGGMWIGVYRDGPIIGAARGASDGEYFEMICTDCPTYEPAEHAYWQVREDGGYLHFEASSDGEGWMPLSDPYPTPDGEHAAMFFAECGDDNHVTLRSDRVIWTVLCD